MCRHLFTVMIIGLVISACLTGCRIGMKAKDQGLDGSHLIPTPQTLSTPQATKVPNRTITPSIQPSPIPKLTIQNKPVKKSNVKPAKSVNNLPRTGRKIAYLTFDDGPSPITMRVLDTLKKYGVHATFFVNGNPSPLGISLYKRMASEGHAIGNHTYSHHYASIYRSPRAYQQDVDKLGNLLERVVGYRPTIMRFPGGSNNTVSHRAGGPYVMNAITAKMIADGYTYFDWNVDSEDASGRKMGSNDIFRSVRYYTTGQRRAIVLLHDAAGKRMTAEALPDIINYLKGQGYEFDVLRRTSYTYQFLRP
ncbi:polysaccharide deacetylase family protein [Paenibacillus sp. KN14-4R]|uniref:polysaccharide deacetylase family protein n=1 Tax=Paenibacillus sp. KN14-4R TaxID=3445773 RepID=UPI003F9F07D8